MLIRTARETATAAEGTAAAAAAKADLSVGVPRHLPQPSSRRLKTDPFHDEQNPKESPNSGVCTPGAAGGTAAAEWGVWAYNTIEYISSRACAERRQSPWQQQQQYT